MKNDELFLVFCQTVVKLKFPTCTDKAFLLLCNPYYKHPCFQSIWIVYVITPWGLTIEFWFAMWQIMTGSHGEVVTIRNKNVSISWLPIGRLKHNTLSHWLMKPKKFWIQQCMTGFILWLLSSENEACCGFMISLIFYIKNLRILSSW